MNFARSFSRFVDWFDRGDWEELIGKTLILACCVLVPFLIVVQIVKALMR